MIKISIQKIKKSDFEEIYPLIKQLWPRERFPKSETKQAFLKQLAEGKHFLVAKYESKIIGFISLLIRHSLEELGKIGIIDELVVNEKFRREGVGEKLLKEIIKLAKQNACKALSLTSGFHRKGAHKFYEKNKFRKVAYEIYKKI
jgi:GNAT superfamily N-acetyltransferase